MTNSIPQHITDNIQSEDLFFAKQGVSSVILYNDFNKQQITNNTTYTLDSPGSDKSVSTTTGVGDRFANTPSSSASQNILGLRSGFQREEKALLEQEVIEKRKKRDQAKRKYTPEQTEATRKRLQAIRNNQALLLRESSDIFRIECTLCREPKGKGKNSRLLNIDILLNPGEKFVSYKSQLQNSDPKTLLRKIRPEYQDWPGYQIGREAIKNNLYAAKVVMRNSHSLRIACQFVHKTVVLMEEPSANKPVMVVLWINDNRYELELIPEYGSKTAEIFSHKGIYQLDLESGI